MENFKNINNEYDEHNLQHIIIQKNDIKKEDIDLQIEEDIDLQIEEDIDLQIEEDIDLQIEEDIDLQIEEDIDLQIEEDIDLQIETKTKDIKIVNRGTGAGGSNTNYYGKKFEDKTNNEINLLMNGFNKISFIKNPKKSNDYYVSKEYDDKIVIFLIQGGLKKYMNKFYNIKLERNPDEAYLIKYKDGIRKTTLKILEKKEQHVEGSVEIKLWSGPSLKREYEIYLGDRFNVEYCYCLNNFLEYKFKSDKKKYLTLKKILHESNINILYGDNENYFELLNNWINE
jgi:hypothetical protein